MNLDKLKELYRKVNEIYIVHPRLNKIFDSIAFAHENSADSAEPECLLVTGIPGVGKSEIIRMYMNDYPRINTSEGVEVPAFAAIVPKPTTIKSFGTSLLKSLGDPFAERGTTTEITTRLAKFIKDCKVKIIFLDEFQHIPESADPDIAADWLKVLIETTRVAVVLFGLPNAAEILEANEQLESRFSNRIYLEPFCWFDNNLDKKVIEGKQKEFKRFLAAIDKELPFPELSDLDSDDIAPRIFYASDGVTRPMMRLIRRASYIALSEGRNSISLKDLETSYNLVLASRYSAKQNPFNRDFNLDVLKSNVYLDHVKILQKPKPGFNNRTKKRKPPKKTFNKAIS